MGNIAVLRNYKWPSLPGDYHRLVILTGDKKGTGYILSHGRIIIGRAPTAQICVGEDIKMSREHAEVIFVNGQYFITDLGSPNGIIVNDKKLKQTPLKQDDRIVIGQTVFKLEHQYISPKEDGLESTNNEPVETIAEIEQLPPIPKIKQPVDKKKFIIYGVVAIAAAMLLFMDEQPNKDATGPDGNAETELQKEKDMKQNIQDYVAEYKKNQGIKNDEHTQKLMSVINDGLREAREKNYFRAINQFNLALIMDPNNAKASRYLDQVKNELEQSVKAIMLKAKWEHESLNYNAALVEYCSIIRIFQNQSENEYYINALDEIKKILDLLGKEYSENYCL